MSHRSYSSVKQIRTCGEQYRLERVARVPSRPTTAAIAGRVVHEATELVDTEIALGETDDTLLAYYASKLAGEILDKEIEQATSPSFPTADSFRSFGQSKLNPAGQDVEWFRKVGIPGCITNYIDWRLNDAKHYELLVLPSGELAVEVPFELDLEGTRIKGQIDRVFTDDSGGPIILDIKTGVKPKSTEQLGVYKLAMEQIHPEGGPYRGSYLYGLKPGSKTGVRQTYPSSLECWKTETLAAIYTQADRQITEELFIPNPGDSCFLCSVTDSCAFYQASIV